MSETERPLRVFLFHAPADRIPARELYLRLIQDGVDAWLVKEKLLPGQDWEQELHNALREADAIVVCISRRLDHEEFRQREARLALDKVLQELGDKIFVVPVLVEECEVPDSLSGWQGVKLFGVVGYEALLEALHRRANAVGAILQSRDGSLPQMVASGVEPKQPIAEEASRKAPQGIPEIVEGGGILIEETAVKQHNPARVMLLALLGFAAIIMMAMFGPAWIEASTPATSTPDRKAIRTPAPETARGSASTPTMRPLPTIAAHGDVSHVVFLIDGSGSMRGQRIRNVKTAVSKFVARLEDDYLFSIIEFNTSVQLRMAATRDRALAFETIQSIDVEVAHNGSCIYDAFYAGIQQASLAPVVRDTENIIILLTDVVIGEQVGWDCGLRSSEDFFNLAWNLYIPVFTIYLGEEFAANQFVTWTGGEGASRSAMSEEKIESTLLSISEAAGLALRPELVIPVGSPAGRPGPMVFVPPGEFIMGDDPVTLDAFWIDKTEVTNAMYARCMQTGPCSGPRSSRSNTRDVYFGNSQFENYPVIHVSWEDANAYCAWAGGRLPTEAEWEKAARGTDGRQYPWGDEDPSGQVDLLNFRTQDTTEVGSFPDGASPYGLLDMAGNVSEWVADWLSMDYYDNPPALNPPGPAPGEYRVWRGGSWATTSVERVRTYARTGNFPTDTSGGIGFRCARDASP